MYVIATLTAAGMDGLKELISDCGKNPDNYNLDVWAEEIARKLEDDANEGNTREVELRGLRTRTGYTVFFNGEDPDLVTYTECYDDEA